MSDTKTFKRLLHYGLAEKKYLIISTFFLLIAVASDLLGPWLIMIFIDQHLVTGDIGLRSLLPLLSLYFATIVIANLASYFQILSYFKLSANVLMTLRYQCFSNLMYLPMRYFHQTQVGEIITRLTSDTEAVRNLYRNIIGRTLKDIVTLMGVVISMFLLDVQLALLCMAFTPVFIGIFHFYRKWALPLHRKAKQVSAEIGSFLNESLQQMFVIQMFKAEPAFHEKLDNHLKISVKLNNKNLKLEALMLRPLMELLSLVMMASLLISFGMSAAGAIKIGVIFAFFSYLTRFFEPLINLMQNQGELLQSLAAGERVFQLLDEKQEQDSGHQVLVDKPQQIEFRDVSFAYQADKKVLKNINININAGAFIALVGPTGSGKSSLINLLKGFYETTEGDIFIAGQSINHYKRESVRRHFALVEQSPFILQASLADNLTLGSKLISEQQMVEALKQAQLWQWVQTLPDGLNTEIGTAQTQLSTGQKQLLSFARALAQQSPVIVLDEASANLDVESEYAMNRIIHNLKGKKSLIVIAHKLNTIREADHILVLNKGEICEQGKHETLLANQGLYAQLHYASNTAEPDLTRIA